MKYLTLLVMFLAIVSCGGGDSSTESSEGQSEDAKPVNTASTKPTDSTATKPTTPLVKSGLYQGKANIRISLDGESEDLNNQDFSLIVRDGRVFIGSGSGPLQGNKFSNVSFSYTGTEDGVTCSVTFIHSGTFVNGKASGTISGPFVCDGVSITMKGTFSTSSFVKIRSPLVSSDLSITKKASKLIR